ncbi:phage tail protein [Nostoc sp. FACHB-145]|uniref:phage tail protein n=1 Tax=Nostoc sp. FACHB-145 TaxID=2692836 RepID=UPI0016831E36|nr:tail fiber protein [Nostoc sp. FACHB-145]MBD2472964.1 phage tail protein [Nostoc sp. FACHB-145]
MSEPFLAEIKITAFNYAPQGWALCNGQLLPINQNQALFSLLGTTYGGNGQTNFALPDFRGRVPIHVGNNFILGQQGGEENHTLSLPESPSHNHILYANSNTAINTNPASQMLAQPSGTNLTYTKTPNASLNASSVSTVGGSQPHENRQPSLVLNFIIALQGIYPSRN